MKKTSRRDFAKTMTAAVAAAPLVLSTKTDANGQTRRTAQATEKIFQHQDTPPPIEILDGSLIIESLDEFSETSGTRYAYKLGSGTSIEHVRVIADNGDKIYEDLDASGSLSRIEIVWINEDKNATGNLIITGDPIISN
jgi:hypothetical protein